MDFWVYLTEDELMPFQSPQDTYELIAQARIKTNPQDPLNDFNFALIYSPEHTGDCGLDCYEVIKHLFKPPIPVYISDEAIRRLKEEKKIGSCYGPAKIEIRIQ